MSKIFPIPKSVLQPKIPKIDFGSLISGMQPPSEAETPETQVTTYIPYPVPTEYPTYTYTPPAVQVTPTPQVQRAAIDPALILIGGLAIVALFFLVLKK